jgi:hypothetical protein
VALTDRQRTAEDVVRVPDHASPLVSRAWVIAAFAVLLLLVLGWKLIADPTLSAPTRDPAWYTWRADVIMDADPASVVGEWGPSGLFSGGYRVTVPLAGAMLQRVADIDSYSFSAFLMVGIPVLTGLALGAGAFRSRRDGLVVLLTLLASAAIFLTTPYVGYLDNITVLFLLSIIVAFASATRESWGARAAVFLVGVAAAFTHPTTCVLFGMSLMAMFGWHVLTARFRFGEALRSDAPLLWSTGLGMIVGLAAWVIGIWGASASLQDAALPPPYTTEFFLNRLGQWVLSLRPEITVPLIVIAVAGVIVRARREREPADLYEMSSIWWMFPFVGVLSFVAVEEIPYYRFMNASAAPIALVGLGAFVAIRWLLARVGAMRMVGALASVAVVGALGFVLVDGLQNRWVTEKNQWADQDIRVSLAAVEVVVRDAGERPLVLVMNYDDTNDPATGTNTAYGWGKTFSNVFRTGLPGDAEDQAVTYLGTVENLRAGRVTTGASEGYDAAAADHWSELRVRQREFPEAPLVFLIGQYYKGLCNGVPAGGCSDEMQQERFEAAIADATEIGDDVWVLTGDGFHAPDPATVERARAASAAMRTAHDTHPGALADPLHLLRVLAGLLVLVILPGWLAAPFFGLRDGVSRIALVPAMSIVLTLLSAIAVLSVWRGPLSTPKAWTAALVAIGAGIALRLFDERIRGVLTSFGNFWNRMFAVFSNQDFANLMGVQFLAQAGQGVVQGAIAKSIAFGGQSGFDVQNVPSADYLLSVILFLYVPYTALSPFIGVFIDRFQRRRVVWWANVLSAIVIVAIAVGVLLPLGGGSTEGRAGQTAALIVGLLAAQAVVRVVLAVKSAAIPDVLVGKDLLQGNALSQAGGAMFQVVGIAFATAGGLVLPSWIVVVAGAVLLIVGAFVARRLHHVEARPHESTFGQEIRRVIRTIVEGLREVAGREPAALGIASFQMLRYQFWGFGLFVFALYAKNLVEGGADSQVPTAISGGVGLVGGILGLVIAQKLKDRVAPILLLLVSMTAMGLGTLVFGGLVSIAGFAAMLFVGFFTFFVGKISADTIVQQAMPDDFRGRAFALFDIAYNLGFIVPAAILSAIWVENDVGRTRVILIVSGAVFLVLTGLVGLWARSMRSEFAPQDDLVEIG